MQPGVAVGAVAEAVAVVEAHHGAAEVAAAAVEGAHHGEVEAVAVEVGVAVLHGDHLEAHLVTHHNHMEALEAHLVTLQAPEALPVTQQAHEAHLVTLRVLEAPHQEEVPLDQE